MQKEKIGWGLDLEGPLVNLEREGHHEMFLRTASFVGVHLTFEEAVVELPHLIGGPDSAVAADIFELSDKLIPAEEIEKRKDKLYREWLESLLEVPTRTGLFDALERIKTEGYPMVIATATDPDLALFFIQRTHLREYFSLERENIVIGGGQLRSKPYPDVYLESQKRMGVDHQLVIEDSVRGVTAGVAASASVIGLPVYHLEKVTDSLEQAGARRVYSEWSNLIQDFDYLVSEDFRGEVNKA